METGILFYFARRTALCQTAVQQAAGWYGLTADEFLACTKDSDLNGMIAQLLEDHNLIFIIGTCPDARPACAEPVFRTLRIPLDPQGEPQGVLKLAGLKKSGYLVESDTQAILLLPDLPDEIEKMLPAAFEHLKKKFGLQGETPAPKVPDAETWAAACRKAYRDPEGSDFPHY